MAGLLLFNASNYRRRPIFPYAFVQLSALARRHGVPIKCVDLSFTPRAHWRRQIVQLLLEHTPELVGAHLRQADSLVYAEYARPQPPAYHPVEDTVHLLALLRELTDAPSIVGGFGFTTNAPALFERFHATYGIRGEPDALFQHFGEVARGRGLETVHNLISKTNGVLRENPRVFYGPLDAPEYDDVVLRELQRFYVRNPPQIAGDQESVAIEVARGCPYRCYFCTEPTVKGRAVRTRDLDAVAGDVEFLIARGMRRFWMVCSELNPGSTEHAAKLAERLLRIREHTSVPFVWHAYHLPRWLAREQLELMARSGFVGGWNDFPSLDDENLKATRVPYRARHAVEHLKRSLELLPASPYAEPPRFSIFLGNAYATPQVIARSLEAYHVAQLDEAFAAVDVTLATRLFAGVEAPAPGSSEARSFTSAGPLPEVDVVHPTFFLAPELTAAAGGEPQLHELFGYISSKLMVRAEPRREWTRLLRTATKATWVAAWLGHWRSQRWTLRGLPAHLDDTVRPLVEDIVRCETGDVLEGFYDRALPVELREAVSLSLLGLLLRIDAPRYDALLSHLSHLSRGAELLDARQSTYDWLRCLLPRFASEAELFDELERSLGLAADSLELFRLRHLLFAKDVVLSPVLRRFVVTEPAVAKPRSLAASLPLYADPLRSGAGR